ncbi:hypothetical protein L9F63_005141, partial [Diploptera punctata]
GPRRKSLREKPFENEFYYFPGKFSTSRDRQARQAKQDVHYPTASHRLVGIPRDVTAPTNPDPRLHNEGDVKP